MRIDSHVHVIGSTDRYPQAKERTYTADLAPLENLRATAERRGIDAFVIVQPSFYTTDNSLLLATLRELEHNGRGVAAVDVGAATDRELAELVAAGVRGIRVNLYSALTTNAGQPLAEVFSASAERAATAGLHVEVMAPLPTLLSAASILANSPATVVIDHYGLVETARPNDEEGRGFLDLVRREHVWTKLSAPYRVAPSPLETRPDRDWLSALLDAAGERCVWGSDWPHTPVRADQVGKDVTVSYRALNYAQLVDDFAAGVADEGLLTAILTDNPARLYGFSLEE